MFSGETFGLEVPGWRATVFIFAVGLFILFLIGVYIADVTQTKHAIRRNYPVIGHFRYYFEHIGTFFRQYFFTMDRERCRSIAHSCGVQHPRQLGRRHARIVQENGTSTLLADIYPDKTPLA